MGPIALLSLIGVLGTAQATSEKAAPELPPRIRVVGLKTLRVRSRLIYRSAPDRPHLMEATFAFPHRSRSNLWVEPPPGQKDPTRLAPSGRMRFQLGDRAYAVDPAKSGSRSLTGTESERVIRELALRRAVLFWPHGHAWERDGSVAFAPLGSAGVLIAHFDPEHTDAPPVAIESEDREGAGYERFVVSEWVSEENGRFMRAARMSLEADGEVIWDEEVLDYDARASFTDSFFLPPDKREKTTAGRGQRLAPHPVPTRIEKRVAIEATDWDSAWKAAHVAARAAERELKETGLRLDEVFAFELDALTRPVAVRLRLDAGDPDEPPAAPPGWQPSPGGMALSVRVEALSRLTLGDLKPLLSELQRTGKTAGTAYALAKRAPEPGPGQLVLPLHE